MGDEMRGVLLCRRHPYSDGGICDERWSRGGTIVVEMSGVGVMLDERLGDGGD